MKSAPNNDPDSLRQIAHAAVQGGRMEAALSAFEKLLLHEPDDLEALNFLAVAAMARGQLTNARTMLDRAIAKAPDDLASRKNLGVLLLQAGSPEAARQMLTAAVNDEPNFFVARLYLGAACERLGHFPQALSEYLRALMAAQSAGFWLSPSTTPMGLRPLVEHATRFVRSKRRELLHRIIAPFETRFGADAMKRVSLCLAGYLGETPITPARTEQRPTFLYFPGLPETPFFPRDLFPWYAEMEANAGLIRNELLDVLATDAGLVPFLGEPPPGMTSGYLTARDGAKAQWDGLFFFRHGQKTESSHNRCPATSATLDATPLVRIRDHGPEALFSVLGAGSHILPHTGVTNTRVVTHLPLVVPGDCALRVADKIHEWKEGRCITFDDTFEHEAWNRSSHTRVVLLFDVWNPHLTEVERLAISELVVAIGDLQAQTQ